MRKYNISANLVRTIEQLYDKADDIDALAEEEQELEALVESLNKTCTRY